MQLESCGHHHFSPRSLLSESRLWQQKFMRASPHVDKVESGTAAAAVGSGAPAPVQCIKLTPRVVRLPNKLPVLDLVQKTLRLKHGERGQAIGRLAMKCLLLIPKGLIGSIRLIDQFIRRLSSTSKPGFRHYSRMGIFDGRTRLTCDRNALKAFPNLSQSKEPLPCCAAVSVPPTSSLGPPPLLTPG